MSDAREQWKRMLGPLDECVVVERFAGALTPGEREHIAGCPRCYAEMQLWQRFNDPITAPEEADVVRWINEQVARRAGGPAGVPTPSRHFATPSRVLAVAATIFLALGIGYLLDNRRPSIDVPAGRDIAYRSAGMAVVAPIGDLAAAPTRLEWTAVPGALMYDVEVLEVDRGVLWRGSTREPRVEVPAAVSAQFVPGKTILWDVTARRDATVLAQSGTQKFRVAVR